MTALTRIAIIARKTIRFGVYLLIIATIIRLLFGTLTSVYRKIFPSKEVPATLGHGSLPHIEFINSIETISLSYKLETPDLSLPTFPVKMMVYKIDEPQSDIQALSTAQETANKLGFVSEGTELVESVYVFDNISEPSKLKMNIVNKNFSVTYDIRSDLSVISEVPPSPESAQSFAESFLKKGGFYKKDLTGPVTHKFLNYQNGTYSPAISLSESNVIEVNLYRKSFENKYPSVTSNPDNANIWFRYSNPQGNINNQLILAEYKYFSVNEQSGESYPIISSEDAWNELLNGNATIVSLENTTEDEIAIRRIYLAYYDPGKFTKFFQPIVVFEGDNNFVAYFPAVKSQHFEKPPQEDINNTLDQPGTSVE